MTPFSPLASARVFLVQTFPLPARVFRAPLTKKKLHGA